MTTIVKIGIGAAVAVAALSVIPALKGPCNRIKNEANDKLNDEYVVDNYKAEYVKLHAKRCEVKRDLDKFSVERRVAEKKLAQANANAGTAKSKLMLVGTSNLIEFNRAKDTYESFKVEVENLAAMCNVYSNAVAKLESSLALIDANMHKAKVNVDTLASKKVLVESIKSVNDTIANLQGVGEDSGMQIAIEKLDDAALRESIKLESLSDSYGTSAIRSEADAAAYLSTVK